MMKYFLITWLLLAFSSHAGLYKGLDEEGNIVYSDVPFENAEEMLLPPISVVDPPKIKPRAVKSENKTDAKKYTSFSIRSPKNNETIWNESKLSVSLQLKPALNTAQGDTTWLIMDGKVRVKNSQTLSLLIGRADRGAHTLQAQVRNIKGDIIKSTPSITVHIKNAVIPKATPGVAN